MARLLRAAILVGCVLSAGSAPAGTYYIAANGSDSNSGTSKTSSWVHAPVWQVARVIARLTGWLLGTNFYFVGATPGTIVLGYPLGSRGLGIGAVRAGTTFTLEWTLPGTVAAHSPVRFLPWTIP